MQKLSTINANVFWLINLMIPFHFWDYGPFMQHLTSWVMLSWVSSECPSLSSISLHFKCFYSQNPTFGLFIYTSWNYYHSLLRSARYTYFLPFLCFYLVPIRYSRASQCVFSNFSQVLIMKLAMCPVICPVVLLTNLKKSCLKEL